MAYLLTLMVTHLQVAHKSSINAEWRSFVFPACSTNSQTDALKVQFSFLCVCVCVCCCVGGRSPLRELKRGKGQVLVCWH